MHSSLASSTLRQASSLTLRISTDSKKPLEMVTKPRNYTIDLLRAVGAFSVITLHMSYPSLPREISDAIFLSGRWAVPFFFLTSGYFFEKGSRNNLNSEFLKTLSYLLNIFIVTNVIYFFVALKTEFYSIGDILSIRTLILGDYIHLWFISSLIFAYLLLWFSLSTGLIWLLPVSAALGLIFCLLADPYSALLPVNMDGFLPRFLLSIPFVFLGFIISKYQLSNKMVISLLIPFACSGFILQFIEYHFISSLGTAPRNSHEFFLGTFLFSTAIFLLAIKVKINRRSFLILIGEKYSLFIYLYHPILIVCIYYLIKMLGWQDKNYLLWFNPITIFLLILFIIKLLTSTSNKVFQILNGRF